MESHEKSYKHHMSKDHWGKTHPAMSHQFSTQHRASYGWAPQGVHCRTLAISIPQRRTRPRLLSSWAEMIIWEVQKSISPIKSDKIWGYKASIYKS